MLATLQQLIADQKNEMLLFDESQHSLFLAHALPLLASGFSVGPISTDIIHSLNLSVQKTDVAGVFIYPHKVATPSILCFSSGTKNNQKGIVRTYASWQNSIALIAKEIAEFSTARGIVFGALPYSLSLFGAIESLHRGKTPIVLPSYNAQFFTALNHKEAYILWATPSHASFFCNALKKNKLQPVESIRYVFIGGAHFSNQQRSRLQRVFPKAMIYSFYGASETSFITLKKPTDSTESVGAVCEGVQVSILNSTHQNLPKNTVGTIWISSNQVFNSYIQKSLKINKLDNFISIDDRGFLDDQNRLFFSGRKERNVSINGHIIDVDTLEEWYKSAFKDNNVALLIISKDENEHELILCYQNPLSDGKWQELKKTALHALGTQGVPKKWVHCPNWPLVDNGKVDMKKLKSFL